jgi:hypothetical protein
MYFVFWRLIFLKFGFSRERKSTIERWKLFLFAPVYAIDEDRESKRQAAKKNTKMISFGDKLRQIFIGFQIICNGCRIRQNSRIKIAYRKF